MILLWIVLLSTATELRSQQLSFSNYFKDAPQLADYSILSSSGNKFYVLATPYTRDPELLVYNDVLELQDLKTATVLKNGNPFLLMSRKDGIHMLVEYPYSNMNEYKAVLLDPDGNTKLLKDIIALPVERRGGWSFISSAKNSWTLLFQVHRPVNDSISISTVLLDSEWEIQRMRTIDLPYSTEFDRLNPLALDEAGNIWIAIYDQPLNFKLSSDLRLYRFSPNDNGDGYVKTEIKEKKPVEFLFEMDKAGGRMALHALYIDFYTKDISGLLTAEVETKNMFIKPVQTFEFDKQIKKDLSKMTLGITPDKLMNFLKLNGAERTDSGFFITTSLDYVSFRRTADTAVGKISFRPGSVTEQNPITTAYQRDALVRQMSGGTFRRRRFGSKADAMSPNYAQGTANAMQARPDLFSTPGVQPMPSSFSTTQRKLYNKWVYLSFDSNYHFQWSQWYKKEFFNRYDLNNTIFDGNKRELLSLRYEVNSRDKLQLLITVIDKFSGIIKTTQVEMPANQYLQLSGPVLKLNEHELIFISINTEENRLGLGKIQF